MGPLGTGVLYIRPGVEREFEPLRCGGTGTRSDEDRQPDELPDKYEPGNHNLLGLAGLVASCEFLARKSIAAIHAHHTALTARLLERLRDIDGLTIHGPQSTANRTSVVSITIDGYDPQELAAVLEVDAPHSMPRRPALCTANARRARHDRRRRHAAAQSRLCDDARRDRLWSLRRLTKWPASR